MQNIQEPVNKTNLKLSGSSKKKDVGSLSNLIAEAGPGTSSSSVVDLSGEDLAVKGVTESSKRRRVDVADKGTKLPVDVFPLRFEGELFPYPNVWSEPDRYGSATSFSLSDPELKVIHDLGTAGQSRAMTELR